jgi:hypothetical protein
MPTNKLNNLQALLAFRIAGPRMDVDAARQSAERLDGQISPSIMNHLSRSPELPRYPKLQPPFFRASPTALFEQNPELGMAHIPASWVTPCLAWVDRLKRSEQITQACALMKDPSRHQSWEGPDDPLVAGLLLFAYNPEPESPLRQKLLGTALRQSLGSYLAAESLHTPIERDQIIAALSGDNVATLGASRVPGFADACLHQARARHDLASGLIVARHGTEAEFSNWLWQTGLAASEDTNAAVTMLVLNPTARPAARSLWLATLQNAKSSTAAYAVVRWTRHTWAPQEWASLKDEVRSLVTQDRGCAWFNWYFNIENDGAAFALEQPADPLWSFELAHALDLNVAPLSYWLADRLGQLTYDREASLVLEALQDRQDLKRKGELHGTVV